MTKNSNQGGGPAKRCQEIWSMAMLGKSLGNLQSNLWTTTTEGTQNKWSYFSCGPICQVWFKNFQKGVIHMPLREPLTSAIGSSHVYSGATTVKAELPNAMVALLECRPAKEKSDGWKLSVAQFDVWGRFSQVESTLWTDFWCLQFAFLRWSHFQKRTPYIWIRELKGLKLRARNFQVVAFVRWSQGQVWLYHYWVFSEMGSWGHRLINF